MNVCTSLLTTLCMLLALPPDHTPMLLTLPPNHTPIQVIHTAPKKLYRPEILKGTCHNLNCTDPPCYVRDSRVETACVTVFSEINGVWVDQGQQLVAYLTHLNCSCKKCGDITSAKSCVHTRPCPNEESSNPESYCYWTPTPSTSPEIVKRQAERNPLAPADLPTMAVPDIGFCDCCEPRRCPPNYVFVRSRCTCECALSCSSKQILNEEACECECAVSCLPDQTLNEKTCECECPGVSCLPGLVLNEQTCRCECPEGTKMTIDGECIGE